MPEHREYWKLSTPVGRSCGICHKDLKAGDIVHQIETDKGHYGFMYIHVSCFFKRPNRIKLT